MKKWTQLDQIEIAPKQNLVLLTQEHEIYSLRLNGFELMSTRQHASEEKLAELGCLHLKSKKGARVLVGGLGFGFTARAVLKEVLPCAQITVAEVLPKIVEWNARPDWKLARDVVESPSIQIEMRDVAALIKSSSKTFDAILLDTDNGPSAFTLASNKGLYSVAGLKATHAALKEQGVLAIWSAHADPIFEKRMRSCGFDLQVHRARAHASGGGWHSLFVGRKSR